MLPPPASFASAADTVPPPCRILGTDLRPFCLGHHLLFTRLGFAFAGQPHLVRNSAEFLVGVALCGMSRYETTLDLLLSGDWPALHSRWLKQLPGPWYARRRLDLEASAASFQNYLTIGYSTPPVMRYPLGGQSIAMTAPWENLLKVRLLMAGLTETEILNGYLPARWYDYYTAVEIQNAAGCLDAKHWRRIFLTRDRAAAMAAVEARAAARNAPPDSSPEPEPEVTHGR